MKLKELKKGEYFCIRPHHEEEVKAKQVYIRGEYDRTKKRYEVGRCNDISYTRYLPGCTEVYKDFIF